MDLVLRVSDGEDTGTIEPWGMGGLGRLAVHLAEGWLDQGVQAVTTL